MIANLLPSLLLFGCASAAAVSRFSVDARYRLGSDEVSWEQYKLTHGKTYYPGTQAAARRTYFESIRRVDAHYVKQMAGFRSFKMTINKMADLSAADYKRRKGYIPKKRAGFISNATTFIPPLNVNIPESVDWRQHGLVTPVKDQGSCGSCWSFAATGALEGQHARKTGQLVSLSEQNLVDCSDSYGNQGCDGGLPDSAFLYVKEAGGIDTEESYPYTAKDGVCHFNPNTIGADDKGFVDLPIGDEEKLKIAVATMGPISVAIDASQPSFQLYSSGVYFEQECMNKPEELDHAVLVVGYGTDPEHGDYWIVKNSWGEDWGEQGYIRMARGKNNHCGIASAASFPLM